VHPSVIKTFVFCGERILQAKKNRKGQFFDRYKLAKLKDRCFLGGFAV